jgi:hypothetical protein
MTARLLALALLAGAACVAPNPPYTFAEGEAKARVLLANGTTVAMMKDKAFYNVEVEKDSHYAVIPASTPIALGRFLWFQGYRVSYHCYPMVLFRPVPDATYVVDVGVLGDRCVFELVREDPTTRTGLAPEPSARGLGK